MSLTSQPGQILLPFAEKEWISVERCCTILDIGVATFYRLRERRDPHGRPLIEVTDYGLGRRQRVLYISIVAYCDRLRERHAIPDQRPPLPNPIFRHRDEDLLPFALSDTIYVPEALSCLGYDSKNVVFHLCEEGAFWAYQILPEPGSPWRISRSDFRRWLESCRNRQR